jgi:cytochrome c oxidase subunit 4
MTTTPHTSHEPSHTADALAHQKHPYRDYLIVWAILMVLLIATVAASYLPTTEPWSFLIALVIAVIKAVLVILFFMHVKDASRVTWVFCAAGFLWLAIMFVLTFGDYLTRVHVGGSTSSAQSDTPNLVMPSEGAH